MTGPNKSDVLEPRQIHALATSNGICVQCGRVATRRVGGYACCGADRCCEQLEIIVESHVYADACRARQRGG